jgi:hypothetical protein
MPEPGTRNLEPGTWNLEFGTWNLKFGSWNLYNRLNLLLQRQSYKLLKHTDSYLASYPAHARIL